MPKTEAGTHFPRRPHADEAVVDFQMMDFQTPTFRRRLGLGRLGLTPHEKWVSAAANTIFHLPWWRAARGASARERYRELPTSDASLLPVLGVLYLCKT